MNGADMNDPHVEKLYYRVIIPEQPTTKMPLPFPGRLTSSSAPEQGPARNRDEDSLRIGG